MTALSMALIRRIVDRIVVMQDGSLLYVVASRSDLYGDNDE